LLLLLALQKPQSAVSTPRGGSRTAATSAATATTTAAAGGAAYSLDEQDSGDIAVVDNVEANALASGKPYAYHMLFTDSMLTLCFFVLAV
jgi:hypothetical protein